MKYESNTPMFSKDIIRKPFFVRTGRTYVSTDVRTYGRTDKGDTICPPIINGGGIKTIRGASPFTPIFNKIAKGVAVDSNKTASGISNEYCWPVIVELLQDKY